MQFNDSGLFGAMLVALGLFGLRRALRLRAAALRVARTKVVAPSQAGAGFARVRGAASSNNPVISPFSESACSCYHVSVEASADDGTSNGSGWAQIHEEVSGAEFFIHDPDGSLRVRPDGLQFDAPYAFEHEVLSKPRIELETRLLDYVAKHVLHRVNVRMLSSLKRALLSPPRAADPRLARWLSTLEAKRSVRERTSGKAYRFREQVLMPGQECEIAGAVLIDRGERVLQRSPAEPFLLSTTLGASLDDKLRHRTAVFAGWSTCCFLVGALIVVFGSSS